MLESGRLLPLALALLALTADSSGAQSLRSMTLIDMIQMPQVSDPQLSPDGRHILYVKSDADWKMNRRITHIWKVGADGSGLLQITNGNDGESAPRWSPDGKTIAFLAKRGTEPNSSTQAYLIPVAGGEGTVLTSHSTAVSDIAWLPDGTRIYFRAADPKSDDQKAREKAQDDVFQFEENYQQQHLWYVDLSTKAETRVTSGDYSILSFDISAGGSRIAMHRAPTPLMEDIDASELWVSDANGAEPQQITKNRVPESEAEISPDGTQVLFLAQANQKFDTYYNRKLFVSSVKAGSSRLLMPDLPYEILRAAWSQDGKSILFLANMGVHTELFQVKEQGGKPEQLTSGEHTIGNWMYVPGAGAHVYAESTMASPGEVVLSGKGGDAKKVTSVFSYLSKEFRLPRQERIQWKGADGITVEGLLYYPLDYQTGKRYPLVVQTHGGPQASDKYGLGGTQNYVPVLAAKGYAVLQPNYRGSTGYGDSFLRDMVGHYFQNAHLDVLSGVDHLIAKGIADPEHLVKMGWSGGGHMTNKVITATNRFKAASSGAGAANWVSMYAQSDVRSYRTPWFGGTPWQKDAPINAYWDNSPLKDAYKAKTPTIFLVGENDVRVPSAQSVEMYRALKSNSVPTHLYIAPREPHGWRELRHVLFKMNVELDWFEKHAMNRNYTWEKTPEPAKSQSARAGQTN